MSAERWEFWIDRGGTFTDVVAVAPDGSIVTHKLLSDNPERYADASLEGIRTIMGVSADAPIPAARIAAVKMGTTVATNALLERKGEPCALLITRGFRDALAIGYQNRPDIFALNIRRPDMLYQSVLEVDERIDAQGQVLVPLDLSQVEKCLHDVRAQGIRSLGIVFMHGYRYPEHEQKVADLAREMDFMQVCASHEVSALIKLIGRGDTTMIDAYLSPILRRYIDRLGDQLRDVRLLFMQSNGGLTGAATFRGKDAILSGPAGGVVGAVATAEQQGIRRIIGFDMGGTSTDVCHYNGEFERSWETEVAGVRLRSPMLRIHTVAAGGGSIIQFDGGRFRVGPESAAADPGPACYRRGGPLTVTDCNVLLGRLLPDNFPRVFGPQGDMPIDAEIVAKKFSDLTNIINAAVGDPRSPRDVAQGFIDVAVENMAAAIKKISVQRGYDVSRYALCCFGGAGGQHACSVADALGMRQVFIHQHAGVLSAFGMGLADVRALEEQSVDTPLETCFRDTWEAVLARLVERAREQLRAQGTECKDYTVKQTAQVRYAGTDSSLQIPYAPPADMRERFTHEHQSRFGFIDPDRDIVIDTLVIELVIRSAAPRPPADSPAVSTSLPQGGRQTAAIYCAGKLRDCRVWQRHELRPGATAAGPALIIEPNSTIYVASDWKAVITPDNQILLERRRPRARLREDSSKADPVRLEIFNKLFMSVAEQMGYTLQNTSYSVNMKERLDFSCAVFDAGGNLVANAPHVPVHLGSMGDSVSHVIGARQGDIRPGDVYVHNAPYKGGTHLPDVTVITPVFDENDTEILFYVASRGHHADLGGVSPGSMPSASRSIHEEGVLIDNFLIVRHGRLRESEFLDLLTASRFPARNPVQNLADLKAQIAANQRGVEELRRLVGDYGVATVRSYMEFIQDNAEASVRRTIDILTDGEFCCEMDNGAQIRVVVRIDRAARGAEIDFTGTSAQLDSNFNAPASVCKAAVLYVFRTLVDDDIPLNAGCLRPLRIVIPEGGMLNPIYPAAVVAGNVETSQAIVDALYGALGVSAASQGTMNNFTFGNAQHQYYETLCGGAGASAEADGASAVHTNMTNSRLTDPEVLELRHPVLVDSFAVRRGSGGAGAHRGGDGVVRAIRFREPMRASILSNRRRVEPFGVHGGLPGRCGRNWIRRANGAVEELPGCAEAEMEPGDVFVVETPGGGGYGFAQEKPPAPGAGGGSD